MAVDLYIDILDRALTRYGSGPISTATYWQSTHPLDKAGGFEFQMLANDLQAAQVLPLRIVRAYTLVGSTWTEIASGVIEKIRRVISPDGNVMLHVSGMDMLREYQGAINKRAYMGNNDGSIITHALAVNLLESLPAFDISPWYYWNCIPDAGTPSYSFSFACYGESCLATVLRVAEMSFCHVIVSGFRQMTFDRAFTDSGVAAIQADGELGANTCAIVDLQVETNTAKYASRIYARGGGNGEAELAMHYSTKTAPTGYTFSAANGYIENDALQATFPTSARVTFKDIIPITNTSHDIIEADNVLFNNALRWLQQHGSAYDSPLYRLKIAQCDQVLKPLQKIRLTYNNPVAGIEIDSYLNILEATIRIDADGLRTTDLAVSASDYWPQTEGQTVASNLQQSQIYQTAAQPDVNNYALAVRGHLDDDNNCTFSLRLGSEILMVQAAFFDFQILPFDDATTSVNIDANTGTSGTGATGGPSTANTSDSGTGNTGNAGSGSTSGISHATTGTGGTQATGDSGTDNTGDSGTDNTGDSGTDNTGDESSHGHCSVVYSISSPSGSPLYLFYNTNVSQWQVGAVALSSLPNGADSVQIATTTGSAHSHTGPSHNHTGPSHNHTGPSHNHTGPSHDHSMQTHTHNLADHAHAGPSHSHTLADHTHTGPSHSHTAPAVAVTHGTWVEPTAGNVLTAGDLNWRINGGAWTGVLDAALGDGWYRIDLGAVILDDQFRPTTELNTIEFKTASTTKAGVINAQISVRNIIQAIAVT